MITFNVTTRGGWYEAECYELGVGITARSLESARAMAVKAAGPRARGTVELVVTRGATSLIGRLHGLFSRSSRHRPEMTVR